jgi:hypothetical protein
VSLPAFDGIGVLGEHGDLDLVVITTEIVGKLAATDIQVCQRSGDGLLHDHHPLAYVTLYLWSLGDRCQ